MSVYICSLIITLLKHIHHWYPVWKYWKTFLNLIFFFRYFLSDICSVPCNTLLVSWDSSCSVSMLHPDHSAWPLLSLSCRYRVVNLPPRKRCLLPTWMNPTPSSSPPCSWPAAAAVDLWTSSSPAQSKVSFITLSMWHLWAAWHTNKNMNLRKK